MSQTTEMTMGEDSQLHVGGSGSTLVLLHGLTGTWHIWKPLLPILEKRHRVVALTLPGHAGGVQLGAGVEASIANLADAIVSTLAQRGVQRAHFAGNSLGGWLSLEMARRGVAQSVTAFSPAGSWSSPAEYELIARPFRQIYWLMRLLLVFVLAFAWLGPVRAALLRQTMAHGGRMSGRDFAQSLFAFVRTRVLLPLLNAMGRDGSIAPLSARATPIRIVWSGEDRVIPLNPYGQTMFQRVPEAEHCVLEGVGHVPMYDDPVGVARHILEVTSAADSLVAKNQETR